MKEGDWMRKSRSVEEMIKQLKDDPGFSNHVRHWHTVDARPAQYAPIPEQVPEQLANVLEEMEEEGLKARLRKLTLSEQKDGEW